MKIRSITFKAPEPKLKVHKLVTVYISEKHSEIIVAPYFKDEKNGFNYEQPNCEIIEFENCGHFPELENTTRYVRMIKDKFNIE